MDLLLSHWHCILPIVGIGIAMFFMRDKSKNGVKPEDKKNHREETVHGNE